MSNECFTCGISQGLDYAHKLTAFVNEKVTVDANGVAVPARLWTSTLRRSQETVQFFNHDVIKTNSGDEGVEKDWVQVMRFL